MSSKPALTRPLERVASRRNVIRSAAWTTAAVTVVVATPNIAAASTPGAGCTVIGTRNGTNFFVRVTCTTGSVTSVQIGSVVATFNGVAYQAKLTGSAAALQTVTIVTTQGSFTRPVTFTVTSGSLS